MTKSLTLHIRINGKPTMLAAAQADKLSTVLRRVSMPGAHEGCGEGRCGCCTVLLDGFPVRACRFCAWQVEGRSIETLGWQQIFPRPHPLKAALEAQSKGWLDGVAPGMVLAVKEYLDANPASTSVHMGILLGADAARLPGYDTLVAALLRVFTDRAQKARE